MSPEPPPRPVPPFLHSLNIQKRVVKALMIRETKTRFGARRLGYLWVVLEPLMHISVFLVLFEFGLRGRATTVPLPLMLLTGLIPFFKFRTILNATMEASNSNQGLFSYNRVKPMDAIISRALLEGILAIFAFFALLFIFSFYMGHEVHVDNVPACFGAITLLWMLGLGCGMIACVAVRLFPEMRRFFPALMRPLYFISGIFFLGSEVSPRLLEILRHNPIFVLIEIFRDGFFYNYSSPLVDWSFVIFWVIATNGIGLMLYRSYRYSLIGKQQ